MLDAYGMIDHDAEVTGDNWGDQHDGFACKHCDVAADMCHECGGPVFPRTAQGSCASCAGAEKDAQGLTADQRAELRN